MARSQAGPNDYDALRRSLARGMLKTLNVLKKRSESGSYNETDLSLLADVLAQLRISFSGANPAGDRILASRFGVSSGVIASTAARKNKPKFYNYVKMISAASHLCDEVIRRRDLHDDGRVNLVEFTTHDTWLAEWVALKFDERQTQIGALVQQLQELVQLAKGSNSRNGRSSILTELERSQLIAVLETALALLRSPMVEVGFLRRLTGWLGRIGQRAAQREAETALGIAANRAWDLMMGLLRTLT